jgi:hypothetical protein
MPQHPIDPSFELVNRSFSTFPVGAWIYSPLARPVHRLGPPRVVRGVLGRAEHLRAGARRQLGGRWNREGRRSPDTMHRRLHRSLHRPLHPRSL